MLVQAGSNRTLASQYCSALNLAVVLFFQRLYRVKIIPPALLDSKTHRLNWWSWESFLGWQVIGRQLFYLIPSSFEFTWFSILWNRFNHAGPFCKRSAQTWLTRAASIRHQDILSRWDDSLGTRCYLLCDEGSCSHRLLVGRITARATKLIGSVAAFTFELPSKKG